jgi:predicted nuclease with TOPRIM domain
MARKMVERKLIELGDRLKRLRSELSIAEEQLAHFAEEAEDARIRSMVSETPLAEREYRDVRKHFEAMRRHRDEVRAEVTKLEQTQDELLDRLAAEV